METDHLNEIKKAHLDLRKNNSYPKDGPILQKWSWSETTAKSKCYSKHFKGTAHSKAEVEGFVKNYERQLQRKKDVTLIGLATAFGIWTLVTLFRSKQKHSPEEPVEMDIDKLRRQGRVNDQNLEYDPLRQQYFEELNENDQEGRKVSLK